MIVFSKFTAWVRSLFARPTGTQRPRAKRREKLHYGSHYYLGDLLQRLDAVFVDMPKFKRLDPDAFALYQRVGATVLSSDCEFATDLEPSLARALPGFGCVFIGDKNDKEMFGLRFGCFMKEKRPVNIQLSKGATYRVTLTYNFDGKPGATQIFVAVHDGKITPLKICTPRTYKKNNHTPTIQRMEWDYPEALVDIASRNEQTIESMAAEIFSIVANGAMARDTGMTVTVKKRSMAAVFAIDILRTPYFFADREKTATENGATKKIIHIVRGHWRAGAGGSKKWIASHFRGLREFEWNGYDVKVGLGGKHGAAISGFDLAVEDPMANSEGKIGVADAADRIAGAMA